MKTIDAATSAMFYRDEKLYTIQELLQEMRQQMDEAEITQEIRNERNREFFQPNDEPEII
jgi:hypothetical protein